MQLNRKLAPRPRTKGVLHCRSMKRSALLTGLLVLLAITSTCDNSERMARLEKQNQELQAEVRKRDAVADLDLQARCGRDAKTWFNSNWGRDQDTLLLDYTNHYNGKLGKCFIFVEYHYNQGKGPSWYNDMTLWNVYENSKYANFDELHFISFKLDVKPDDRVVTCEVLDQKCKTIEEFNGFVRPYLND